VLDVNTSLALACLHTKLAPITTHLILLPARGGSRTYYVPRKKFARGIGKVENYWRHYAALELRLRQYDDHVR
jgi:hypothetical protein